MNKDEFYIKRCIQLAKNGLGTTYPNPLVGSVIVHNDKIIGEGWHYQSGKPHAEVNAVKSVKDKSLLAESTIYVSLEPCSHHGKTPPCSDLIIENGIKKVVIGTIDPFAKVAGRGIQKLINAGCDVKVGILEDECNQLNKRFFTFHTAQRPYIILKWAETADGFIAPNNQADGDPIWITNRHAKQLVHKWRTEEQAIMVGSNTVIKDNPRLTARLWHGQNPVRVALDRKGRIADEANLLKPEAETIIFTTEDNFRSKKDHITYSKVEKDIIPSICKQLYNQEIQSIIIEGGSTLLQAFIDQNIWDEARVFKAPITFETGIKGPNFNRKIKKSKQIDNNTITYYTND